MIQHINKYTYTQKKNTLECFDKKSNVQMHGEEKNLPILSVLSVFRLQCFETVCLCVYICVYVCVSVCMCVNVCMLSVCVCLSVYVHIHSKSEINWSAWVEFYEWQRNYCHYILLLFKIYFPD